MKIKELWFLFTVQMQFFCCLLVVNKSTSSSWRYHNKIESEKRHTLTTTTTLANYIYTPQPPPHEQSNSVCASSIPKYNDITRQLKKIEWRTRRMAIEVLERLIRRAILITTRAITPLHQQCSLYMHMPDSVPMTLNTHSSLLY